MAISDARWDGSSSRYTPQQWKQACLLDRGGDPKSKDNYSLPVREPDGTLNRHGLAAAAGRLHVTQGITAGQRAAIARKLVSLYREADMVPPDRLRAMVGHDGASAEPPGANAAANDSAGALERMFTEGGVEVRSGGTGRRMTVGGYAAVFNQLSRRMEFGYEQVAPSFFEESRRAGYPGVVARWNHDSFHLLGATSSGTLRLSVDATGLDYSVDLPECRSDLFELIQRRDVSNSSFAFMVAPGGDDWEYRSGSPVRTLLSGKLLDVAPVAGETAAYPNATVALRSLARHVGAPVAEVSELAERGELRKLFTRTDIDGGAPVKTMTAAEAMERLEARRRPGYTRATAAKPLYAIQHENMQRLLRLRARRNRW
jgi:uncharacterized protein